MTVPPGAKRQHTAWIAFAGRPAVPVRYATTDNDLVCFGDTALQELRDSDAATVTIHEIACGPPIESFSVVVREMSPDELTLATVAEAHGNAPDPVDNDVNPYDFLRRTRRFLALQPEGDDAS
jgi:hypothetical protein